MTGELLAVQLHLFKNPGVPHREGGGAGHDREQVFSFLLEPPFHGEHPEAAEVRAARADLRAVLVSDSRGEVAALGRVDPAQGPSSGWSFLLDDGHEVLAVLEKAFWRGEERVLDGTRRAHGQGDGGDGIVLPAPGGHLPPQLVRFRAVQEDRGAFRVQGLEGGFEQMAQDRPELQGRKQRLIKFSQYINGFLIPPSFTKHLCPPLYPRRFSAAGATPGESTPLPALPGLVPRGYLLPCGPAPRGTPGRRGPRSPRARSGSRGARPHRR